MLLFSTPVFKRCRSFLCFPEGGLVRDNKQGRWWCRRLPGFSSAASIPHRPRPRGSLPPIGSRFFRLFLPFFDNQCAFLRFSTLKSTAVLKVSLSCACCRRHRLCDAKLARCDVDTHVFLVCHAHPRCGVDACAQPSLGLAMKAEAAGLRAGDVMTGASAVFGDAVWSVKEKSIEEIRSLVRCR